eukprot:364114-Chlamydomonas_euryale.AAC.8
MPHVGAAGKVGHTPPQTLLRLAQRQARAAGAPWAPARRPPLFGFHTTAHSPDWQQQPTIPAAYTSAWPLGLRQASLERLVDLRRDPLLRCVGLQLDDLVSVVLDHGRGLGVERRQPRLERLCVVVLATDERLASDVVLACARSPHKRQRAALSSPHQRQGPALSSPHQRQGAALSSPHQRQKPALSSPHQRQKPALSRLNPAGSLHNPTTRRGLDTTPRPGGLSTQPQERTVTAGGRHDAIAGGL